MCWTDRHETIMCRLQELWIYYPELRLYQLLEFVKSQMPDDAFRDELVAIKPRDDQSGFSRISKIRDAFYVDDDVTLATIERLIGEVESSNGVVRG